MYNKMYFNTNGNRIPFNIIADIGGFVKEKKGYNRKATYNHGDSKEVFGFMI